MNCPAAHIVLGVAQVRIMETPGAIIGASSIYGTPAPLPFAVTAIRKTECVWFERQDLKYIIEQCTPAEAMKLGKCLRDEHNKILDSLKSRDMKVTRVSSVYEGTGDEGEGLHLETQAPGQMFHRLAELEQSTEQVIEAVHALSVQAKLIPYMVDRMGRSAVLDGTEVIQK